MAEKRRRLAVRIAPCPLFDIEGIESWLGEMAAQGLTLRWAGTVLFWFERCPPRPLRYRLDTRDDPEARSMSAAFGWQFVDRCGPLAVYAAGPDAPELHTDPRVQAIALGRTRRRATGRLVYLLLLTLWSGRMFCLYPIQTAIAVGTPLWAAAVLLVTASFCREMWGTAKLIRFGRRLARGVSPDHRKDWRRGATWHRLLAVVEPVLLCLLVVALLASAVVRGQATPLAERNAPLPYDAAASLSPNYTPDAESGDAAVFGDLLAPVVMDLTQRGSYRAADGEQVSVSLNVLYFETASPALARALAKEWLRRDTGLPNFYDYRSGPAQALPLPDLPMVDTAVAYEAAMPTLLLVDGCRMVRIQALSGGADGMLPLADVAPRFAGALAALDE